MKPPLTLADLCALVVDCEHKTAPLRDDGYPSIRTPNVGRGRLLLDGVNRVDDDTYRAWTKRAVPQPGDLIVAREAPVGNVAIIPPGLSVCLGQRTVLVRPDRAKVDPRFLCYFMLGDHVQQRFKAAASGATVPHLNMRDIRNLPMPRLPDLRAQRRIASILGAYDDLIEVNRRRIAVLEEMARRLFDEWFVHFRFPGHDRETQRDPTVPPSGWRRTTFGALVDERRDTLNPADIDTATAYVGLEHIPRRSTTLDAWGAAGDVTSTKLRFHRGDILFGKIRPYFHKVAWAPFGGICSSDAIVWRPRSSDVAGLALAVASSDAFVAHSVQTSNGTKMPRANPSVLARYSVPLPPPNLLLQFNESVMAGVELAASLQAANRRLAASRDLLLPRLISGDLPVATAERELEAVA